MKKIIRMEQKQKMEKSSINYRKLYTEETGEYAPNVKLVSEYTKWLEDKIKERDADILNIVESVIKLPVTHSELA